MWCHFHLHGPDEQILDEVGVEVESLAQVREQIQHALSELRRQEPDLPAKWAGWRLVVVDHRGRILAGLDLGSSANSLRLDDVLRKGGLRGIRATPQHGLDVFPDRAGGGKFTH